LDQKAYSGAITHLEFLPKAEEFLIGEIHPRDTQARSSTGPPRSERSKIRWLFRSKAPRKSEMGKKPLTAKEAKDT